MLRIALGTLTAALLAGCVMLPLPGYGGVIYLPQGRVELPREMSLAACAVSVRTVAQAETPAALGRFHAMPSAADLMGNVLGICSAPDGARHLVLPNDIQPGLPILTLP